MCVSLFVRLIAIFATFTISLAAVINVNPNPMDTSTAELAAVIDADPVSNDLNEHLNSIVEGRALAGGADNFHAPIAAMAQPPQPIADSKEPIDDLKSDASGWYKYYGYRPPYHSYYRPPSYNNYWPYEHRYNYPYHHNRYPPYDYYGYRPNEFYSGNFIYNPYRRQYSSFYY